MTKNIKTILSAIIVAFLVVIVILPCTMNAAAETTNGSSGSTSKVYTHNFTEDGLTSDFFTIDGNTTDSKGAVVYNGMDLSICLKMQSSPKTSIKFTTKTDGATLTVVAKTTESSATLKLDGSKWGNTITGDLTVITKKLGNASTYELTKGSGESLIYFIMVEEAGETPTTEAPTTEAPTTEAPTKEAPTTEAPTTEAPTTEAPTTEAPTTEAPTTEAPTTEAPTTEAPTTEAPTTEAPTTEAPTEKPTSGDVTNPSQGGEDETIGTSQGSGSSNSENDATSASPNKMENNEKGTGIGDIFTAIIVLLVIIAIIALIVFDSPLKKIIGGIINGKSNSNY